ncbi:hypothetical protein ACFQ58_00010 [Agromyces sp. NPDC056523]|uniref:hypothetical protein n=1 Tax=Agromyces sp. NPDC056523 TaxID=3345850 RepID=UPI00366F2C7A
MNRTPDNAGRPRVWQSVLATFVVALSVFGATVPATAATASVSGSVPNGSTIIYSTPRTTKSPNAATIYLATSCSSNYGCGTTGGAAYTMGMRTSSNGWIASTSVQLGQTKAFASGGSTALTYRGTFYLSAGISGYCGASPGCGTFTWSGTLNYDL